MFNPFDPFKSEGLFDSLLPGKNNNSLANIPEILKSLFSEETKSERKVKKGDIVGVNRGLYEHYGIYAGGEKVIHYTSESGDVDTENEIMETSFKRFLRDAKSYFILDVEYLEPRKFKQIISPGVMGFLASGNNPLYELILAWQQSQKTIYSPEETVSRARSRIGEKKYNLALNNCEHFAVWCKTGLSVSYQMQNLLKGLPKIPALHE